MSEKREYEGILMDFIGRYWYLATDKEQLYFDTLKGDESYIFNGLERKKVRITIEVLDDNEPEGGENDAK